jgi:hypothetical protein
VSTEGSGGSELAQFVTNHILGDIHGNMTATVMDRDSMTYERREYGRGTTPGFQNLLVA